MRAMNSRGSLVHPPQLVVEAVHQQRQTAAELLVPQRPILRHRREHQAFPDRAAAKRRVADVADNDAALAIHPLEQRRTRGNRTGAADNGVVGINTERREKSVHGTAPALVEAGHTSKNLSVGAVNQKMPGQVLDAAGKILFHDFQGRSAEEVAHRLFKDSVIKLADG